MIEYIRKYEFGEPYETGAVIEETVKTEGIPEGFRYDEEAGTFFYDLHEKDMIFGLGETVRGINKRGWIYVSNNSDDPAHDENKTSLYASQNFMIVDDGERCFGLFVDNPGTVTFDIGYSTPGVMSIHPEYNDTSFYLVDGQTPLEIVGRFRRLIGASYIPPKWAFGYGQSRWGYKTADDIREVARRYKELDIPIDMIYMDIDYMQDFKDFTVNPERFPDFEDFVKEMREEGIHLVPIIDAGVKIEDGYDVYEEGKANGYFCKKENGEDLVAAVWPGKVHFPDFLNDDARRWFGKKYKVLTDAGIEGFWNDMNEPAIFYTEDHLKEVFEQVRDFEKKELDIWGFFDFKDVVGSIANNPEDYRRFYHDFNGRKVRHDRVHNLYGFYMTRSASESFEKIAPGKEILMFSRASYTGMHRYGGVWTGDNTSRWSHLLMNIQMMPALGMNGFLFSGADIGGFGGNTTEDLMMRWIEFGIFTPLFRNHSALGTRDQELYRFDKTEDFRNLIKLRYALIPYIYSEFIKAVETYDMYMKPLWFEYRNDDRCREVEDQLLVGDSIMIAPVYEQNKTGRYVYLPEKMKLVRFRSCEDCDTEILDKGDHYVSAALNEVLVFIRPGKELSLDVNGGERRDGSFVHTNDSGTAITVI
ncbi:MAG: alpha-glucosidase [Lachnospiraceae bacterium]|nr:alpha-glucosidase [Lachnospiraceae bacterium]